LIRLLLFFLSSCLLLTTDADWKSEGANQSACTTEDYLEAQKLHRLYSSSTTATAMLSLKPETPHAKWRHNLPPFLRDYQYAQRAQAAATAAIDTLERYRNASIRS